MFETICFAMENELVHFTLLKTVYSEGVQNDVRGESWFVSFSQRPQRLIETLGRCTETVRF